MKRWIAAAAVIGLLVSPVIGAKAITTGRWDVSGIHETIQRVAEDTEPEVSENTGNLTISDAVLEQIYAAIRAQRAAAERFFSGDRKGMGT